MESQRIWQGVALSILLLTGQIGAVEPLRIVTNDNYAPFSDLNANGELVGFDVDVALALCQVMQRECELTTAPWEEIVPGIAAGKYDFAVASMSRTPERQQFVDFTEKYYHSNSMFVGKAGADIEISPAGLRGKTLAAARGTTQSAYLLEHYAEIATITLVDTTSNVFELLAQGEADVGLEVDFAILEFLKTEAGQLFDLLGDPVLTETSDAHIALQKGRAELREALNQAIRTIRADGTYSRINRQYFPFDVY